MHLLCYQLHEQKNIDTQWASRCNEVVEYGGHTCAKLRKNEVCKSACTAVSRKEAHSRGRRCWGLIGAR